MSKYRRNIDEIPTRDDMGMKQAVEKWLEVYRLRQKFDESSIVNVWNELIGPSIANRTETIYINNKKLFVKVESAVIKHELKLMRRQIIQRVNEHVGRDIIEELVIL